MYDIDEETWREGEQQALETLNRATLQHWNAHGRAHGQLVALARREGPSIVLVQYGPHHGARLWEDGAETAHQDAEADEATDTMSRDGLEHDPDGAAGQAPVPDMPPGVDHPHNERMRRRLGEALAREGERGLASTRRETLVLEWEEEPDVRAMRRARGRSVEKLRAKLPATCLRWSPLAGTAVLDTGHGDGALSSATLLVVDHEERWERAPRGTRLRAVWNIRAGAAPSVRIEIGEGESARHLKGTVRDLISAPSRRRRQVERNLAGETGRRGEAIVHMDGREFKAAAGVKGGDILREARMRPWGLSLETLAHAAGLSNAALGEILRGRATIGAAVSARLGAVFEEDETLWAEIEMACAHAHLKAVRGALLHTTHPLDPEHARGEGRRVRGEIASRAQAEEMKAVLAAFKDRMHAKAPWARE